MSGCPVRLRLGGVLLALVMESASAGTAQVPDGALLRVSTGATPESVTVGDRFRSVVRIALPAGARVDFPALPPRTADVQPTDSVRLGGDGGATRVAAYPMVVWSTGNPSGPTIRLRVTGAGGRSAVYPVRLAVPRVRSVLPADSAAVEPRPARGVIETALDPRLLAILAAVLVLSAAAAYIAWRRARRPSAPVEPILSTPPDPRARALAILEQVRARRLIERREWKPAYTLIADALRGFLAASHGRWGMELTTDELLVSMATGPAAPADPGALRHLLREADRVKFARYSPTVAEAEATWKAARAWLEDTRTAPAEHDGAEHETVGRVA